MSKGKDIESEDRNDCCPIKRVLLVVDDSGKNNDLINSNGPPQKRMSIICETDITPAREARLVDGGSAGNKEPQDADYNSVPPLSDEIENLILARTPRLEHWKLPFINKRILALLRTAEIYKIRKEIGVTESSVFVLATGDRNWWTFDRQFSSRRKLPDLPADSCFSSGDKESLCASTHLIVSGREIEGLVIWRYELETNSWKKGPSMISPRCLFASASNGTHAFVAGGVTEAGLILNSAEKYNPYSKTWEPIPWMHEKRRLCSGCYMDNKFYVIGGRSEDGKVLTCGEAYDDEKKTWEVIPSMLEDTPVVSFQSPPLIAVVSNELYSLETSSNELKVYIKSSRTWRKLGPAPVSADSHKGWGVAFKSLGDELIVIGASTSEVTYSGDGMAIYTCCPNANADKLEWTALRCGKNRLSNFILNCSIMVA